MNTVMHSFIVVVFAATAAAAGQAAAAKAPTQTPPAQPLVNEIVARRLALNAVSIGNIAACQQFNRDYAGHTEKLLAMTYTLARQTGIKQRSFARDYRKQVREEVERQTNSFAWRARHPGDEVGMASIRRECSVYWTIFQGDMRDTEAMLQKQRKPRVKT